MKSRYIVVGIGILIGLLGLVGTGCEDAAEAEVRAERQAEAAVQSAWDDERTEQLCNLPSQLEFEGTVIALEGAGAGGGLSTQAIIIIHFADGRCIPIAPAKYILREGSTYLVRLSYKYNGIWWLDYLEER